MGASAESEEVREGALRLAAGRDPTGLCLSPEEGFLLSRIDGATPWSVLREIGGLPPEHVDRCLERWLSEGIVEVAAGPADDAAVEAADVGGAELVPGLELDLSVQRRILEFESRLDAAYHEILGVAADAEPREIKRAYFRLSREFHPDRYFRREIGPFRGRLERIFRKLLEAHEMLSDPTARAEIERSFAEGGEPAAAPGTADRKSVV